LSAGQRGVKIKNESYQEAETRFECGL